MEGIWGMAVYFNQLKYTKKLGEKQEGEEGERGRKGERQP
jgi:hypothetical protein